MRSRRSHCSGVQTPPGMRRRTMKAKAFSSFLRVRSGRRSRLQIHAVELDELLLVLGDGAGRSLGEPLGEGATQIRARLLDALVARKLGCHGRNPRVIPPREGEGRLAPSCASGGGAETRRFIAGMAVPPHPDGR